MIFRVQLGERRRPRLLLQARSAAPSPRAGRLHARGVHAAPLHAWRPRRPSPSAARGLRRPARARAPPPLLHARAPPPLLHARARPPFLRNDLPVNFRANWQFSRPQRRLHRAASFPHRARLLPWRGRSPPPRPSSSSARSKRRRALLLPAPGCCFFPRPRRSVAAPPLPSWPPPTPLPYHPSSFLLLLPGRISPLRSHISLATAVTPNSGHHGCHEQPLMIQGTCSMAMEQCRIWWPRQQLEPKSGSGSSSLILFGWLFVRKGSIDVVVASALPQDGILRSFSTFDFFQTIIHSSNKRMPVRLQESTAFTILGDCCVHVPREFKVCCAKQKHQPLRAQLVQKENFDTNQGSSVLSNGPLGCEYRDQNDINRKWGCDCTVLDGFLDTCKKSVIKKHNWVHFCCESRKSLESNLDQIPMLHHFYLGDQKFEIHHCHVILYDVPTAGRNHFSLGEHALYRLKDPLKRPCWMDNLQQKPLNFYLDSIILALNCSNAVRLPVDWEIAASSSAAHFLFVTMFDTLVQLTQHCIGMFLATVSTIIYIFIQLFQKYVSHVTQYLMLQKIFSHSWKNIHLRSCQILYWPIFLQDTPSSMVNVEYAHRAAIQKHGLWSNVVMDILMGFVLGVVLLLNTQTICSWIFILVHNMTDNVLRSGCVWLMGVPAGFKLNTELAELLGMISLNAIQIYSTLWFIVGGFLRHIIQGIAFSGILLGFTVPVSFFVDIIQLATLHVRTLQWLISMIYSRQIQTVTSLWRLFRGRKWNPLRQRLDSYDYTVEQHVVGSLLFTPVLLLLPTTSIFYIFFSILSTTIICLCIVLETVISIIHFTPYSELILWVTRRQRFPAGLSFIPVSLLSVCTDEYEAISVECSTSGYDERRVDNLILARPGHLVSELCCIHATFGQVVGPKYRNVFLGIGFSFCKQLAYGILSGARIPSTLNLQLSPLPWMHIGIREYWMLCHCSLLSREQKK